jgi:hydrogenase small subunit
MSGVDDGLYTALLQRGMSRRSFLRFTTAMAATLALPAAYAPRIAAAVAAAPRVPVIWLRGQGCGGDTEAFLRAAKPTVSSLVLDLLSIDYHEALMAPSGAAAEASLASAMERHPNGYLAIVEGAVPTADGGVHCMVGGRPFRDVVREVCDGALGTIAIGACAFDGGAPGAAGGPTGAVGVGQAVPGARVINLPGCPINVENLTATIVHYLTFSQFPVTDGRGRPLFAYGGLVHNQCERRAHFEFGEFATAWGDEASQKGWCLYKLGCKGPETFANCPTVRYAEGTSWNVMAGHGCVGCTMPRFWDAMGPAYRRLPSPLPIGPDVSADQIGQLLVGGVGALTVVHGTASYVRQRRAGAAERRAARTLASAGSGAGSGAGTGPGSVNGVDTETKSKGWRRPKAAGGPKAGGQRPAKPNASASPTVRLNTTAPPPTWANTDATPPAWAKPDAAPPAWPKAGDRPATGPGSAGPDRPPAGTDIPGASTPEVR